MSPILLSDLALLWMDSDIDLKKVESPMALKKTASEWSFTCPVAERSNRLRISFAYDCNAGMQSPKKQYSSGEQNRLTLDEVNTEG